MLWLQNGTGIRMQDKEYDTGRDGQITTFDSAINDDDASQREGLR